ncbi:MAG: phage tail protein [Porticoccus sp.]|nr:phage tail protein [Porticoccus sp.]
MSIGQVVGGIIGGILGGAPGASIGMAIGGYLDPVDGPSIEGPRLSDLTAQTAAYGVGLADIDGTVAVSGNVFWVENGEMEPVARKEDSGGKGGGSGGETTTYEYYATFAVGLTDHQVRGLKRVWVGADLVIDTSSTDLDTTLATGDIFPHAPLYTSASEAALKSALEQIPAPGPEGGIRFYPGFDDQETDPRMEADLGVGNCPAYRGMSYLVFYDWPLARHGNSIAGAQVKAELIDLASDVVPVLLQTDSYDGADAGDLYPTANYLWPEKTIINQPAWSNSYEADVQLGRVEYNTGGPSPRAGSGVGGSLGIEYDGTGSGLIQEGIVDDPDFSTTGAFIGGGSLTGFSGTRGRFVLKNEVFYGCNWLTDTIYRWNQGVFPGATGRDMTAADTLVVGGNPYAITVDDDGLLYVLFSASVKVYDATLTEVATRSFTFDPVQTPANRASYIHWDSGVLWIAFNQQVTQFYFMPDDLSVDPEYIGTIAGFPTAQNIAQASAMTVKNGIMTRFGTYDDNSTVVERWKLPSIDSSTKALSSVVRERMERSEVIESGDIDVTLLTDTVRGFRTAGVNSIRSSLQPHIDAYQFDIIPDGYQIKCVPRGQVSVLTIDYDDLDARGGGGAPGTIIEQQREMDNQLPQKVVVKHLDDALDYDVNQQDSPERRSSYTVNVVEVDLPIVFTPDEAAGVAEVIQYARWLERDDFSFNLPASYNALQPADVITVPATFATLEFRLISITYLPDGRLECTAKLNDSAIYTPNAVGGTGVAATATIPYAGEAVMAMLDIPLIRDQDDLAGYPVALCGLSTSWPGGVIARSNDLGQTWKPVQGFASSVTMGVATNSLPEHNGATIDRTNTLNVSLYNNGMSLSSITEDQMMASEHWCAYGADDRWELIRFAGATLETDGSYTLDTLIRGSRGTEWATGLHEDYDTFVYLADADMAFLGGDIQYLNTGRLFRGLTTGQDIDDVTDTTFSYDGENLKPFSPVLASAAYRSDDILLSWVRRSRLNHNFYTTGVLPVLGEDSEAWQIDIMDGATVVRTLTATDEAATYTSAQQVTDFGANQTSITCNIYQISATVGRGVVGAFTLTPEPAAWKDIWKYADSGKTISAVTSNPEGIWFSSDMTVGVWGSSNPDLHYHESFTTGGDLDSGTYEGWVSDSDQLFITDLFLRPDGTYFYTIGINADEINEYSLSTPYDITTKAFVGLVSSNGQESNAQSFAWKPDGTKLYIVGTGSETVYQYTVSPAWDISTRAYDTVSFSVVSECPIPRCMRIHPDGEVMLVADAGGEIHQYSLGTAWDMSTAVYTGLFLDTGITDLKGFHVSDDGSRLMLLSDSNNNIQQFEAG